MILERGAGRVVLTLGSKGSVIGTQENPMPKHVPVTPAEPVDTTVSSDVRVYICKNYTLVDVFEWLGMKRV